MKDGMPNEFRGEVKPRRSPSRHHIEMSAAAHQHHGQPLDPFPPLSNSQFPQLYVRSPVQNAYRKFMRAKSAYRKPR
jgi:hypothetical protein